MSLPTPEPGLIIRYSYLWHDQALHGIEEGLKDRPCAVVMAIKRSSDKTEVAVVPITHSPPSSAENAIEIPVGAALRLGLDADRSWIITHEANTFVWPGPDIRPIRIGRPRTGFAFGFLPRSIAKRMLQQVRENIRRGGFSTTSRS